jgi:hypothetical protein
LAVSRFLARLEEKKGEKERSNSSRKEGDEVAKEEMKQENKRPEGEGEFSQTFEVVQGVERLAVRQEFGLVVVTGEGGAGAGAGLSLDIIKLSDRMGEEGAAMQHLSTSSACSSGIR